MPETPAPGSRTDQAPVSGKQRFRQQALDSHGVARATGPAVEPPKIFTPGSLSPSVIGSRLAASVRTGRLRRRVPVRTQVQASDCGPTCLAMVLAYHGLDVDLGRLLEETRAGRDGVSARVLLDAARRHGLTGRGVSTSLEGLRGLAAGSILFWNFGHFVVLERVTRDHVEVVDPSLGRRRIPLAQVGDAFTGVALEFAPPLPNAPRPVRRGRESSPWPYLRHFFPRTRAWVPLSLTSLVLLTSNLVVPLASAYVVEHVARGRPMNSVGLLVGTLIVVVVVFFALQLIRNIAILAMQTVTDKRVTLGVLAHLMSLPYDFFSSRHAGDLTLRVRTSAQVRQVLTNTALTSIFDGLLIIVYMALLLVADRTLALVVIVLALVQVALLAVAWRRQQYLAADALEAQSRAQSELVEIIDGMATLKAAGLDSAAAERWSHSLVEEINSRVRSKRTLSIWTSASLGLQFAAPLTVLLIGSLRVSAGELSLGKALGFSVLAMGLFVPLANLVQSGLQLSELGATLARMGDILRATPENEGAGARRSADVGGGLALQHVDFAYPGARNLVLADIDVDVRPGEFVVILGASGGGKSTLAMLLAGLYLPSSGHVLIGGVPTDEVDRSVLRESISFVNQDSRLFAGSVWDNIVWGTHGLTYDEVKAAAVAAGVHGAIRSMPMGYDTLLGPGGVGLSGGQRQRVALTRALVRKPRLLILDEATSALDPQLEESIFANLLALDCTLVVVAHRLSRVEDADRIVVLSGGRVVQQGRHRELVGGIGPYNGLRGKVSPDPELSLSADES